MHCITRFMHFLCISYFLYNLYMIFISFMHHIFVRKPALHAWNAKYRIKFVHFHKIIEKNIFSGVDPLDFKIYVRVTKFQAGNQLII